MPRHLTGSVTVHGVDHETVGGNDIDDLFHQVNLFLFENQPSPVDLQIPDLRWGGECRVETRVSAQILGDGRIHVLGITRLFEGTSEGTTDLEETDGVDFIVEKTTTGNPAPSSFFTQLRNGGQGDFANVDFKLFNTIIEE